MRVGWAAKPHPSWMEVAVLRPANTAPFLGRKARTFFRDLGFLRHPLPRIYKEMTQMSASREIWERGPKAASMYHQFISRTPHRFGALGALVRCTLICGLEAVGARFVQVVAHWRLSSSRWIQPNSSCETAWKVSVCFVECGAIDDPLGILVWWVEGGA